MDLILRACEARPPGAQPVEVVERKGAGHPDTICDALTEQICVRLCRHYQERFGVILHHNVDKILLCAGSARPTFGGGEVTAPIELYLAGRATMEHPARWANRSDDRLRVGRALPGRWMR
jgi:S-adenosylmethionine synthetase